MSHEARECWREQAHHSLVCDTHAPAHLIHVRELLRAARAAGAPDATEPLPEMASASLHTAAVRIRSATLCRSTATSTPSWTSLPHRRKSAACRSRGDSLLDSVLVCSRHSQVLLLTGCPPPLISYALMRPLRDSSDVNRLPTSFERMWPALFGCSQAISTHHAPNMSDIAHPVPGGEV